DPRTPFPVFQNLQKLKFHGVPAIAPNYLEGLTQLQELSIFDEPDLRPNKLNLTTIPNVKHLAIPPTTLERLGEFASKTSIQTLVVVGVPTTQSLTCIRDEVSQLKSIHLSCHVSNSKLDLTKLSELPHLQELNLT